MSYENNSIFWVEIEKVVPNPFQPRREFDESKLKELGESIRMYGLLQPLTVTRKEIIREDGSFSTEYELIAGERRLRASKYAGLAQVPVIIRSGEEDERMKLELAIIENLQREDLNAVDRALAFKQLVDQFELSHSQVAKKMGRSREYVSNSIRLLQLPDTILNGLRRGDISDGHARTLLMLNDRAEEQDVVYREILLKKLSVREVERITRKIATDKVRKKSLIDPELIEIEKQFTESLGTRVQILKTDYGGKVTIDYFSQGDLDMLLALLKREADADKKAEADVAAAQLQHATPLETVPEDPAPAAEEVYTRHDDLENVADEVPGESEEIQHASEQKNPEVAAARDIPTEVPKPTESSAPDPVFENQEPAAVLGVSDIQPTASPQTAIESEPPAPVQSSVREVPTHTHTQNTEESPHVPSATVPAPESEKKKEESEDANLYSIKNFSI